MRRLKRRLKRWLKPRRLKSRAGGGLAAVIVSKRDFGFVVGEFAVSALVRVAAVAACAVLLSPAASAQTVHGVGNTTCAQFLRAARMSDMLYHQASNWLLGYVSGMNAALASTSASASAVTLGNDQLMKSAGNYCEANPNKTIANAAAEWFPSLPRQAVAPAEPPPRTYDHLNKPFARPLDRR